MKFSRGGLHVDSLVSGGRDVKRTCALVSTASPRTVLSPGLASRVARSIGGMTECTSSPSIGKACGPTALVDVVVDGCRAVAVRAVVAPLPGGLDMAIGHDVIERSVRAIDFATVPATFRCRVPKHRR